MQPLLRHGCGGWGWQLGRGAELGGRLCPGTCCVSREQCPAASQAGGVLSVPALLTLTHQKEGAPHPGNAILREAKQETWTPSHVTGISQGQLQRCPGLDKK